MKALILAAGFGKRLQPLTDTIPKSMVEVNGTPLLANALNNLTALGITDIGIVVGHMADYIREHIGNEWNGAKISYYEKVLGSLMYLRECDIRTVEVSEEMWCEIDDAGDLARAGEKFGSK